MKELLRELKEKKISLAVDEAGLKVKFNGNSLPPELLKKIRENRDAIIAYLKLISSTGEGERIMPAPVLDGYPLSSSQLRIWLLSQLDEQSIAFHIQGACYFEGNVSNEALEKAFLSLIERHEILRTVFRQDTEGNVKQYILPAENTGFSISFQDLQTGGDEVNKVSEAVSVLYSQPFNLEQGPLLRVTLGKLGENRYLFGYVLHHIIGDSWSMEILIRELMLYYNAAMTGKDMAFSPLPIQYKDFAWWQQHKLDTEEMESHRRYWLQQFSEGIPVMDISRRKRPVIFTYQGNSLRFTLPADLTKKLLTITQAENGTYFITLLALIKLLLHHYTTKNCIMVGTSFAGRENELLENQIGLYINNLPLITRFSGDLRWTEYYELVKNTVVKGMKHQAYPLDELVKDTGYQSDPSRPGIFNVLMELHTNVMSAAPQSPSGFTIKPVEKKFTTTNFDLGFECKLNDGITEILLQYNTSLFEEEEIELMRERLISLARIIAADPSRQLHSTAFTRGETAEKPAFRFQAMEKF